jgi:hypothetical protein
MLPNDFMMAYTMNDSEESDPEAEMDFTVEEEDEEEEEEFEFETVPGELTGLLLDAALNVEDIVPLDEQQNHDQNGDDENIMD